jgi:hypothetical protein
MAERIARRVLARPPECLAEQHRGRMDQHAAEEQRPDRALSVDAQRDDARDEPYRR